MTKNRVVNAVVVFIYISTLIVGVVQPVPAKASSAEKTAEKQLSFNGAASEVNNYTPLAQNGDGTFQMPVSFMPNQGQIEDGNVKFHVSNHGGSLFFKPGELHLAIAERVRKPKNSEGLPEYKKPFELKVKYKGANRNSEVIGLNELPGKANFLYGDDPAGWVADVPTYGAVMYKEIYPGIDMVVNGGDGNIKTSFIVAPQADPSVIQWDYQGGKNVAIVEDGTMQVKANRAGETRTLRESAPIAWQVINGETIWVPAVYSLDNKNASFALPYGYDPNFELVIDPTLEWSTYVGNSGYDEGNDVTVDSAGNIIFTGYSMSSSYPTTSNAGQTSRSGDADVVVTKLNPTGTAILYSTYLGGGSYDEGYGIAVDSSDNIYVAGRTASTNFPTTSSKYQSFGGDRDAFFTKIGAEGDVLLYSTYLGGSGKEEFRRMVIDSAGIVYATGYTESTNFPTTENAYDTSKSGTRDLIVVKIDPGLSGSSSLLYSSLVGGTGWEDGYGIALDSTNNVYLAGMTTSSSSNFPKVNPIQASYGGGIDATIMKMDLTQTGSAAMLFSTFLGGSDEDYGYGIELDANNNIYITGKTESPNLAVVNAVQNTFGGGVMDVFVAKVNTTSSPFTLSYFTYLGGSVDEEAFDIGVDQYNQAHVIGYTTSIDFPTEDALYLPSVNSCATPPCEDAFLSVLAAEGDTLVFSSHFGGTEHDWAFGTAIDPAGNTFMVGGSFSTNFPIVAGYDAVQNETTKTDVILMKISPITPPETATPTPTVTPTPTNTQTPTPTSTPTATSCIAAGNCELTLSAATPDFKVGELVEIDWQINADPYNPSLVPNWKISFILPPGFTPETPANGIYDSAANTFDILVPAASGSLQLMTTDTAQDSVIYAELRDGTTIIHSPMPIKLTAKRTEPITSTDGGEVVDPNGGISVNIPPAALPEPANVTVWSPQTVTVNNMTVVPPFEDMYEIIAVQSSDGTTEIHQLNGEAELIVPVDPKYLDPFYPIDATQLVLSYFDTTRNEWMPLITRFDESTLTLRAKTNHFSLFSVNTNSLDKLLAPPLDAAQTSGFTGSAAYSFPISVPTGAGGVAPSVSLSYSSQSVEGLKINSQGGITGIGWSLDAGGSIFRNPQKSQISEVDDTFSLVVGGFSSQLIPVNKAADGKWMDYQPMNQNFWKIRRYILDASNTSTAPVNSGCPTIASQGSPCHYDKWVVWDKVGTQFTFDRRAYTLEPGDTYRNKPWGWFLTETKYPNGQVITFTYEQIDNLDRIPKTFSNIYGATLEGNMDVSLRLKEIKYSGDYYKVEFIYSDRKDISDTYTQKNATYRYEPKKLDSIVVYADGVITHKYQLGYNDQTNTPNLFPTFEWKKAGATGKALVLESITEYGVKAQASQPPITFKYGEQTLWGTTKVNGRDHMHLTQVNNGQGGVVTFIYEDLDPSTPAGLPYAAPKGDDKTAKTLKTGEFHIPAGGTFDLGSVENKPGSAYNITCSVNAKDGGSYQITTETDQSQPTTNFTSETVSVPASAYHSYDNYSSTVFIHSDAKPRAGSQENTFLTLKNTSTKWLYVKECKAVPVVTHYRILMQITEDLVFGDKYVTKYSYEKPGVNSPKNTQNPDGLSEKAGLYGHDYSLTTINSDFWGHAVVTVTNLSFDGVNSANGKPNEILTGAEKGNRVETKYHQQDYLLGQVAEVKTYDSNGVLLSWINNQQKVEVKNLPNWPTFCARAYVYGVQQTGCYLDQISAWTRPEWEVSRGYGKNGAETSNHFMGMYTENGYDGFNNETSTLIRVYNAGANVDDPKTWSAYRKVETIYVPNQSESTDGTAITNLISLPGASITYKCSDTVACNTQPSDIVDASCTIYNGSSICTYNNPGTPQSGVPYASRRLLEFRNNNYADPLYVDARTTYDAYGNQIKNETFLKEGTNTLIFQPTKGTVEKRWGYISTMGNAVAAWEETGPAIKGWRTTLGYLSGSNGYYLGLPTKEIDFRGAILEAEYDAFGRTKLIKKQDLGDPSLTVKPVYEANYSDFNQTTNPVTPPHISIKSWFDTAGTGRYTETRSYYDGLGRKYISSVADVDVFTGLLTINGRDIISFSSFDKLGRNLSTSVPYDIPSGMSNAYDRPADHPGENPASSRNVYDASGQLIAVVAANGSRVEKDYDVDIEDDNLYTVETSKDASGNFEKTYKDNFGRMAIVKRFAHTGAQISEIRYEYDVKNNLTAIRPMWSSNDTSSSNHATTFTYDFMGRKKTMNDPNMGLWEYTYDVMGNLIQQKDANGQKTCTYYDELIRTIGVYHPDLVDDASTTGVDESACPTTNPGDIKNTFSYVYDTPPTTSDVSPSFFTYPNGKTVAVKIPAGSIYMAYDMHGRLTSQYYALKLINDVKPGMGNFEMKFDYYFDGQVQSLTYPGMNHINTIIRDDEGRSIALHRSSDSTGNYIIGGQDTAFDEYGRNRYLPFGFENLFQTKGFYHVNASKVVDGITLGSDILGGKLMSIAYGKKVDGANIFKLTYEAYDASGNITKLTDLTARGNQTHIFTYDAMNRLKTARADAMGDIPNYHQKFIYGGDPEDPQASTFPWSGRFVGRQNLTQDGSAVTFTLDYVYDNSKPHAVIEAGNGTKYTYDQNGNMVCRTEDGVTYHQEWTADNLLKKVYWNDKGHSQGDAECKPPAPPATLPSPSSYDHEVTFTYGASENRILRVERIKDSLGRSVEVTTVYLNGSYEKQIVTGTGVSSPVTTALDDKKH